MNKPVFFGVVENDLSIRFLNPAGVKNALLPLKGETIQFTFTKRKKHRSDNQNAYYHGVVIRTIADYCGYRGSDEIAGIHEELKRKFLPKRGRLQITRSTASLSTEEFGEYLEDVKRWAAEELGLYIPEPNESEY